MKFSAEEEAPSVGQKKMLIWCMWIHHIQIEPSGSGPIFQQMIRYDSRIFHLTNWMCLPGVPQMCQELTHSSSATGYPLIRNQIGKAEVEEDECEAVSSPQRKSRLIAPSQLHSRDSLSRVACQSGLGKEEEWQIKSLHRFTNLN